MTKRYDYVAIENSAPPVRILMENTTFIEVTLGTIMKGDSGIRGLCSNYNENKEGMFKFIVYLPKNFPKMMQLFLSVSFALLY